MQFGTEVLPGLVVALVCAVLSVVLAVALCRARRQVRKAHARADYNEMVMGLFVKYRGVSAEQMIAYDERMRFMNRLH